ncbi:helix-turn-helix domain-containing protein [Mongoliitalea lutea]|uniref:Helicase n=1 Tax=Mongoliitalea lutea TaxID=849756 RepID=A0A8J3CX38_9BACT|nr:helix-turn-helix domain-containing protein [Mongoliitalea lutea]GHB34138.1 helicase [Mongoliitalea lutea]
MEFELTDKIEVAAQFVNSTNRPIFLTGKAGTGKTTFLRKLTSITHKNFIIVAPTGIASLNAKGVTIHSQFLLPFGSFIPSKEPEGNFSQSGNFYSQFTLGRRHALNGTRRKVLRSVDLIIIDEVSMLRADILDAIDYRMKSLKRNFDEPFGGVQVLMIGDLFQLPPIVKNEEWAVLGKFYKGMHFFEALAIQNSGMVYIELDKIFRQKDQTFIDILNKLRLNKIERSDVDFLNRFFKTEAEIEKEKEVITITTHNYKADQQNRKELDALPGKPQFFEAVVEKDFPESLYPVPYSLELKVGAQIMFIKNDSSGEGAYYNGKMATVTNMDDEGIEVRMSDSRITYYLTREVWENKRYAVQDDTKEIQEEVIGTFQQYPIKLAWAVTVHKSQGLTFDKAIIDVGQAFAPGQVYVALSRLRSLDGLILRTKIQPTVISSDPEASQFTKSTESQEPLDSLLSKGQQAYMLDILEKTFNFYEIMLGIQEFQKDSDSSLAFEDEEMNTAIPQLLSLLATESENTLKFQRQLAYLAHHQQHDHLTERLEKGSAYYQKFLLEALAALYKHMSEVERFSQTKQYLEKLEEIDVLIFRKLLEILRTNTLVACIINGEEIPKMEHFSRELSNQTKDMRNAAKETAKANPKFTKNKTGKKKKEGGPNLKKVKGETYEITFELHDAGLNFLQIAEMRGLAESTIKTHLAKGIQEGRVDISQHFSEEYIDELKKLLVIHDFDLSAIRQEYPGKYDFGSLKMVLAHINQEE